MLEEKIRKRIYEQFYENNKGFYSKVSLEMAKKKGVTILSDHLVLWHATSKKNHKNILKQEKLNSGTFFGDSEEVARFWGERNIGENYQLMQCLVHPAGVLPHGDFWVANGDLFLVDHNFWQPNSVAEEKKLISENKHAQNKLYMLIGPPAIGKSSWIKKYAPNALIINRDDILSDVAKSAGLSYQESFTYPPQDSEIGDTIEGFEKFGKVVESDLDFRELDFEIPKKIQDKTEEVLAEKVLKSSKSKNDVVIDMTNMYKKFRSSFLPHYGDEFYKVAVEFDFHSGGLKKAIKANMLKRAEELKKKGVDKFIPDEAYDRMYDKYEPAEYAEGFDEILKYDNSEYLLSLTKKNTINELKMNVGSFSPTMKGVIEDNGNHKDIKVFDFEANKMVGSIEINKTKTGDWEVIGVAAFQGFGPSMYEIAMMNVFPEGLMPDRNGKTTDEAYSIWEKFFQRGDIHKIQNPDWKQFGEDSEKEFLSNVVFSKKPNNDFKKLEFVDVDDDQKQNINKKNSSFFAKMRKQRDLK